MTTLLATLQAWLFIPARWLGRVAEWLQRDECDEWGA